MTTCHEFEDAIDRELSSGLTAEERERLLDHLDTCDACSELFDLLSAVKNGPLIDEPSEHELARMRRRVLNGLDGLDGREAAVSESPSAATWRPTPGWSLLAAGLAVALVGAGIFLGRRTAPVAPNAGSLLAAGERPSPAELRRAGYRFTRADVEELAGDRLRLRFDVSRSMELAVDRDDPMVTEVLVQSLAVSSDLGARLSAVERAGERLDPRVENALVDVMRRDESVAVRLAAQEKLLARGANPEVADAMLELLEREESVQMRLAAIDYLTENSVDADRLERAIEAGTRDGERALYVRASRYLNGREAQLSRARP